MIYNSIALGSVYVSTTQALYSISPSVEPVISRFLVIWPGGSVVAGHDASFIYLCAVCYRTHVSQMDCKDRFLKWSPINTIYILSIVQEDAHEYFYKKDLFTA